MKPNSIPLPSVAAALLLSWCATATAQTSIEGLAVYLNFDNNIDAQAGTTNGGTIYSGSGDPTAKYTTGVIGGAVSFNNDGSASAAPSDWAVSLGNIESIYAGDWSFSLWVNTTNNLGAFLGNKDWNSGANVGWLISEYYTTFLNYKAVSSPRHDIGPGSRWSDGTWHHVGGVFNRNQNKVQAYVDGIPVAEASLSNTGTESLTPTNIVTTLVGGSGNGSYSSSGQVDDLGIWTRALAPEAFAAIYLRGSTALPLVSNSAPVFVRQPVGGVRSSSDSFKLTSTLADDRGPVTYQWYEGSTKVSGATNSSLLLTNLASGSFSYTLVANDGIGSITSAPAALTVIASSQITNALQVYLNFDNNILAQAPTTTSGTAIGAGGASTYTPGIIGAAAAFANDGGSTYTPSDWAVSLGDIEHIYTNSWSFSVWVDLTNNLDGGLLGNKDWTSGSDVGWVLAPYNTTEVNYSAAGGPRRDLGGVNVRDGRWHHVATVFNRDLNSSFVFVDGTQVASATVSATGFESLTDSSLMPNQTLVGGSGPGAYSGSAAMDDLGIWSRSLTSSEILAIYAQGLKGQPLTTAVAGSAVKPVITAQPKGTTIVSGFGTSISVGASGTAPLIYRWFKDGTLVSGETNASIIFPVATTAFAGTYSVTVSNLIGSVTSTNPAVLTVLPPANSLTNGLVVYLDFEKNLLGKAGTTNNAVAVGTVGVETYTNGIIGTYAASFNNDGSGDAAPSDWAASLGDIDSLYDGSFSFSIWVKTTDTLGAFLGNKDWNSGGNIGWLISEYYTTFLNYRAQDSTRHDIGPGFSWADNNWHHISAVFYRDINTVYTYVDSVLTAKASLGTTGFESLTPTSIATTLIGSSGNGSYSAFGQIDDLGLWSRPLTEAEIIGIYRAGQSGQGIPKAGLPTPTLVVSSISNNTITLNYPAWAAGYTLQSTPAIVPATWSIVQRVPTVSGTNAIVTLPLSGTDRFYRLNN
jgi:Concanavalin A-like lectin/glucanases superfamily